jgi:hypothetical protein
MFEVCLYTDTTAPVSPFGPGPTTLLQGDTTLGYYGEMAGSDFFTTAEVSAGVGYAAGTVYTAVPTWIKMIIDGVVIYIPKTPLKSQCFWNDIYNAKSVYGEKTIGKYPVGAGVKQNAQLVKGGYRFKVRLGSAGADPLALPSPNVPTNAAYAASEWGRIINALALPKRVGSAWGLYDMGPILTGHVATKNTYSAGTTNAIIVEAITNPVLNAYGKSTNAFTWVPILELTTDATWGDP